MAKYFRKIDEESKEYSPRLRSRGAPVLYEYESVSETPAPLRSWEREYDDRSHAYGRFGVHHRSTLFTPYFDESHPTGLSSQFLDLLQSGSWPERKELQEGRGKNINLDSSLDTLLEFGDHHIKENQDNLANEIKTVKEEFHPSTLFHIRPETVTIDTAFFDKSMTHTLPTLGMVIKRDFPGATMKASYDLSEHSSKLAKHASELGLIEGHGANPQFEQRNRIERPEAGYTRPVTEGDVSKTMRTLGFEEIPQQEIDAARSQVREVLRGRRQQTNLSPQFDHPTLPGI